LCRINHFFIFLVIGCLGCTPHSEAINYGQDSCQYCQMIIVDQRYACELVTAKGKVYMFDAVECLINFTHNRSIQNPDIHFQLVTSYDQPGKLIAAGNCQYLRSAQMPSPMGMFLTPFEKMETAMKFQARHGGKIYDWVLLNDQFKNLPSIKIEEE